MADLPVGSLVQTNVNGVAKNFIVVHQGLPSSLYDESCDGIWCLMQDIYTSRAWDSTNNDYENSDIHAYLNGTFIGLFDSEIQSVIKQIKLPYHMGVGNGGSNAYGASGLSTKVFLLSFFELGWSNNYACVDGDCLSYFNGLAATDSKCIAYLNGTATDWWLRTPYKDSNRTTSYVYRTGGYMSTNCTQSYGIRPALILPSNAVVNPTPNADGSYTLLV